MNERSVSDIALDPKYSKMHLSIREEKLPDGSSYGVLLLCSRSDGLFVEEATQTWQKISGGSYYYAEPMVEGSDRKVTLIGDKNSKIL